MILHMQIWAQRGITLTLQYYTITVVLYIRVISSCSTSGTRHVNLVTNSVIISIYTLDNLYDDVCNLPDEGYSRNASCALNLISTFLFKWRHITFWPFINISVRWFWNCGFLICVAISIGISSIHDLIGMPKRNNLLKTDLSLSCYLFTYYFWNTRIYIDLICDVCTVSLWL